MSPHSLLRSQIRQFGIVLLMLVFHLPVRGAEKESEPARHYKLAQHLEARDKPIEAQAEYRAAVAGYLRLLGPDDPKTLQSLAQLAFVLFARLHISEAQEIVERYLPRARRVLKAGDPTLLRFEEVRQALQKIKEEEDKK